MIDEAHLRIVKDLVMFDLLVKVGGEVAWTYEELQAKGLEFDGYAVRMLGTTEKVILRVMSPEALKEREGA